MSLQYSSANKTVKMGPCNNCKLYSDNILLGPNCMINLFSTNIPYMEHHFHELILAQWGLIFGIINALLH